MNQLACETCDGGGFCTVHQMPKVAHWTALCRTNPRYRRAWDEGRGPGQNLPVLAPGPKLPHTVRCGAGTELQRILGWFGIHPSRGCGCAGLATMMDFRGPDWCLTYLERIVSHMQAEAQRRGLPFWRPVARGLVRHAIWRTRRKSPCRDAGDLL